MKHCCTIMVLLISFFPLMGQSQSNFEKGFIITLKGERIEDSIKLSRGELLTLVLKKKFMPAQVKSFSIATTNYISYSNDFYKEVTAGTRITLYQKATDNRDEEIYNGIDFVGFAETTDGTIGDYYILQASRPKLDLITKRNFNRYFLDLIVSNDSIALRIKSGSLRYQQIKDVAELYNNK